MATKATLEIATIDVEMFTFAEADGTEYLLKSASEITVAPEIEEREATKLIVKDRLIAQKRGSKTITGNTITLTDNVFSPELVLQLQGGEITYSDPGTNSKIASYTPLCFGGLYGRRNAGNRPVVDFSIAHQRGVGFVQSFGKIVIFCENPDDDSTILQSGPWK